MKIQWSDKRNYKKLVHNDLRSPKVLHQTLTGGKTKIIKNERTEKTMAFQNKALTRSGTSLSPFRLTRRYKIDGNIFACCQKLSIRLYRYNSTLHITRCHTHAGFQRIKLRKKDSRPLALPCIKTSQSYDYTEPETVTMHAIYCYKSSPQILCVTLRLFR